jgi:hypothetical protein
MTWQEYQEAVSVLYEQLEGVGTVLRNQRIPDRVTGQPRQIDTLLILETKGHKISIVIDAKFHSEPIDVKTVEEVAALADAIGSSKSVIVAMNGWTEPAAKKAEFLSCDLRLLTLDDALDLIVPDKWMLCPNCERDCVVLDQTNIVPASSGLLIWWLAGACRECRFLIAWCQDCGTQYHLKNGESVKCYCGHVWDNDDGDLSFTSSTEEEFH